MLQCTPHPGLGAVSLRHGAHVEVVDLATCKIRTGKPVSLPSGARIVVTPHSQSIVYRGRTVFTVHEDHSRIPAGAPGPIELFGMSPNRRWVLFAIDPQGSESLAADGLTLQAAPVAGGRPRTIGMGLLAADYQAWCGDNLVMTAGGDRIASHHKWLIAASPPDWHVRKLLAPPAWSFGALACNAKDVVVQAAPNSVTTMNPRWQVWRVGLAGGRSVVDRPPPGWADDSPRISKQGRIVFVRSRGGNGTLYAAGIGPLLAVGRDDGFYGHRPWASVTWSLQAPTG